MWVNGLLKTKKICERIVDLDLNDEDDFITFITNIKMFGLDSKGDVRRLLKNNGIKLNNQTPPEKLSNVNWIRLNEIEFAIVKKGKNEFDFIFNQFIINNNE